MSLDHQAAVQRNHKAQLELMLSNANLGPLHLLYLMAVHQGDFDARIHQGQYAKAGERFSQCVAQLMDYGLIKYTGAHYMTPRGTAYVDSLLAVKLKA